MSNPFDSLDLNNLYASGAPAPAPAPSQSSTSGGPPPLGQVKSAEDDPFGGLMGGGGGASAAPPPLPSSAPPPAVPPSPAAAAPPPPAPVPPPAAPPAAPAPQAIADPWAPVAPAPAAPPPGAGAMVPSAAPPSADPFGVMGGGGAVTNPFYPAGGAPPPPVPPVPVNPGAMYPPPAPVQPGAVVPSAAPPGADPFGVFATGPPPPATPVRPSSPVPAPAPADPYAQAPSSPPIHQPNTFPGYDYTDSPPPAPPAAKVDAADDDDDFWATMGLTPAPPPPMSERVPVGASEEHGTAGIEQAPDVVPHPGSGEPLADVTLDDDGLPAGGEKYTARIQSPTLGVIFFTAAELLPSVFVEVTSRRPIEVLKLRPVVGHCFGDSAALAAGIMPGHVLLSVNGKSVTDPTEAKAAIRDGARPLKVEFYILPKEIYPVTFAEGMHMVKYDTPDEGAPLSQWEWKPKYVVIGGIIAKPWMMMMYRSRAEYDHSVKAVMADRSPSVKIKQFGLLGAHIYRDEYGLLDVHPNVGNQVHKFADNKAKFVYFSIIPRRGYPIKISGKTREDLKHVHMGVRRVLKVNRGGGYEERMAAGERNVTNQMDANGRRRRTSHLSFYERPTLQAVGSY